MTGYELTEPAESIINGLIVARTETGKRYAVSTKPLGEYGELILVEKQTEDVLTLTPGQLYERMYVEGVYYVPEYCPPADVNEALSRLRRPDADEDSPLDGVESLDDILDVLPDAGLGPHQTAQVGETIADLLGDVHLYLNSGNGTITRLGVVEEDGVRVLAYLSSWKWLGPYSPDNPEAYLKERGYTFVPRADEADADEQAGQETLPSGDDVEVADADACSASGPRGLECVRFEGHGGECVGFEWSDGPQQVCWERCPSKEVARGFEVDSDV